MRHHYSLVVAVAEDSVKYAFYESRKRLHASLPRQPRIRTSNGQTRILLEVAMGLSSLTYAHVDLKTNILLSC